MTSIRPRVIDVPSIAALTDAELDRYQSNDLLVDEHYCKFARNRSTNNDDWCLWNPHYQKDLEIKLDQTASMQDPLNEFKDVLADGRFRIHISLHPSRASTRGMTWVDPIWHEVCLYYVYGHIHEYITVYPTAGHAMTIEPHRESDLDDLREDTNSLRMPQGSIRIIGADEMKPAVEEEIRRTYMLIPVSHFLFSRREAKAVVRDSTGEMGRGFVITIDHTYERITALAKRLRKYRQHVVVSVSPLDHWYCPSSFGVRMGGEEANLTGLYTSVWARGAHVRWPWQHRLIVDLVLVFGDVPPYVLLEILDWLPYAEQHKHVRKINLIMAVRGSIRNAHETRALSIKKR
jgi:hypothetical protein